MPIEASRLRESFPGPTLNDVIEHPGRYPEAEAQLRAMARRVVDDISRQLAPVLAATSMVQDALRVWQEEQRQWASVLLENQRAVQAILQNLNFNAWTASLANIEVLLRRWPGTLSYDLAILGDFSDPEHPQAVRRLARRMLEWSALRTGLPARGVAWWPARAPEVAGVLAGGRAAAVVVRPERGRSRGSAQAPRLGPLSAQPWPCLSCAWV